MPDHIPGFTGFAIGNVNQMNPAATLLPPLPVHAFLVKLYCAMCLELCMPIHHLESLTLIAARQMCHSPPKCGGGRAHCVDISISFADDLT
jgi:hypothetical protein